MLCLCTVYDIVKKTEPSKTKVALGAPVGTHAALAVISWFVEGGLFPERVDDGGATCDCEVTLLSVADGFRASCKCFAMVALDPLVTRWREAKCRRRTPAGKRASCPAEQPLMLAGGATDDERQ